jgi:CHAT domain-containing protein
MFSTQLKRIPLTSCLGLLTLLTSGYAQYTCAAETSIQTYQAELPTLEPPQQIDNLLKIAHAYHALGQRDGANQALQQAQALADKLGDKAKQALVLNSLSDAQLLSQKLEATEQLACQGLELAKTTGQPLLIATLYNTLGNVLMVELAEGSDSSDQERFCSDTILKGLPTLQPVGSTSSHSEFDNPLRRFDKPLQVYQAAWTLVKDSSSPQTVRLATEVLINTAHVYSRKGENKTAFNQLQQALTIIQKLPKDGQTGGQLLSIGKLLLQDSTVDQETAEVFQQVLQIGTRLKEDRLVSYANGYLGELYARHQRYAEAQQLFQQAIFYTQTRSEELSRWYWQLGRLYRDQGQQATAKEHFQRAVDLLQPIRPALMFGSRGTQSFRDSMGSVYLDLITLLLQEANQLAPGREQQALLQQTRKVLEMFRQVELENYFKDDCVAAAQAKAAPLETLLTPQTAVIYPIVLAEKTVVLLSVGGVIYPFTLAGQPSELRARVKDWRGVLEDVNSNFQKVLGEGHSLYKLLIEPLEPLLTKHDIKTLVIVPDDVLRTIPFAALNSKGSPDSFLMREYAIMVVPGLSLIPSKISSKQPQVLLSGISKAVCHSSNLPGVAKFAESLKQLYPQTAMLMDEQFTAGNLEQLLQQTSFQVLIFATHAKFSSSHRGASIVSHDDPSCKISLEEFSQLLHLRKEDNLEKEETEKEMPLELLGLTACSTAQGSDRATLGLAGAGIKAGANTVLGTLWRVDDEVTNELMMAFFKVLQRSPTLSKAQALQEAQKQLVKKYQHPFYWAGFLVIGNGW